MKYILMTLGLAAGVSSAYAQNSPKITSQSIIVNPVASPLKVSVWTAKDPTGSKIPTYVAGDRMTLNVKTTQDAYVYLFNVDQKGNIDLILPNKFTSGANFIKANTTKSFPSKEDKFTFDIAGPAGLNKVLAVASKTELDLNDIAQFKEDQTTGFATVTVRGGQNGLAQALSIIVKPLPSKDWVTDVAQYQISAKVATPPVPVASTTATWKSTFKSALGLNRVYEFYANQLKALGYEADQTTTTRQQIVGDFSMADQSTANLTVKQRPGTTTYDVVLTRKE
ncbi:DUF4384 domain-containing protein [Deinococcus deserti]|uniref:Putative S-layer-like protein array-related protein n=1 Tax=Deinococcus deserti (strain DSM 17065 / CIP 109153 / LMG 22923 / VCD115) TaxID=546414 RepID=C1CWY3_DEIDV|nr:DUF4384 domain-containing protein [Deinococcus deserti]ACO46700.1 putative S-layer-like protein array-related protein, precursor [Deinococcus deserti VCD115]